MKECMKIRTTKADERTNKNIMRKTENQCSFYSRKRVKNLFKSHVLSAATTTASDRSLKIFNVVLVTMAVAAALALAVAKAVALAMATNVSLAMSMATAVALTGSSSGCNFDSGSSSGFDFGSGSGIGCSFTHLF